MDPLEAHDVRVAAELTPSEKLAQALELMGTGLRLKREALARQHPAATPAELERMYTDWLFADE